MTTCCVDSMWTRTLSTDISISRPTMAGLSHLAPARPTPVHGLVVGGTLACDPVTADAPEDPNPAGDAPERPGEAVGLGLVDDPGVSAPGDGPAPIGLPGTCCRTAVPSVVASIQKMAGAWPGERGMT